MKLSPWILSTLIASSPLAATAVLSLPSALAQTEADKVLPVVEKDEFNATEALARANEALNRIQTAKGRFAEMNPNGVYSQGNFYLSRPGRLRFEYDAPDPRLFVSDGTMIAFEDRDFESVEIIPLSTTPLSMLIGKESDLAGRANIRSIQEKGGFVSILMSDKAGETDGTLELLFDPKDYALKQWITNDALGQSVIVELRDVEYGVKLKSKLFQIEDPEDEDDRR